MRENERDAVKMRQIERSALLNFAEVENLNLIPLQRESKHPQGEWKKYQEQKYSKENWREKFIEEGANIAVVCGKTSGNLVIVDCDKPGLAERLFGEDIAERTFVVETGGNPEGRRQVYFKTDYPVQGRKFHEFRLEVLGQGNYGVYPPSIHPTTGRVYKALRPTPIASIEGDFYQEFYSKMKDAFRKFDPEKYGKVVDIDKLLKGVEHGQRDEALIRILCWLREGGLKEEQALDYVLGWNKKNYSITEEGERVQDPLTEGQIEYKTRYIYGKPEPYHYRYTRAYVHESVYPDAIVKKAEEILENGNPFKFVNEAVAVLHAGDENLLQIEWVSIISSQTSPKTKINLWQIGKSQSGKSHSMYSTLRGVPPEYYEIFTSSSGLAFFYYIRKHGEWSLDKKLIYIDEVEASKRALPILRALTGQTEITPRHLSVHEAEILDLKIRGKRSVWFTSVRTFGTEQIKNRFIHLNPDESEEQDEKVHELQVDEYWNNAAIDKSKLTTMQAITQKICRDTKHLKVTKSFKPKWEFKSRRWLFPIFASFVDTIARVNYKQRKIEDGYIIAEPKDVAKASQLWKTFEKNIIYRVSQTAQNILDVLPENAKDALTRAKIGDLVGLSTRRVGQLCEELLAEGLINQRKRSSAYEYWKARAVGFNSLGIEKSEKVKRIKEETPISIEASENGFKISSFLKS